MKSDISDYRKSYLKGFLSENEIFDNPLKLFNKWFDEISENNLEIEINAMTLSTIDNDGFPRNRVVLLKYFSDEGFTFFTNYNSNKAKSILNNNKVSLSFFWEKMERQIIIKGRAFKTTDDISDKYFKSRPLGSKIGALVSSNQSSVIPSRSFLEDEFKKIKKQFENTNISRPINWGGFIVKPIEYEFWQGRENRLHDRIRYNKKDNKWIIERLSP
jgi:pyridoxamine 5'-phosphate oxidase